MATGKLYLIPTPIGEGGFSNFFPAFNAEVINTIDYYIVEELRTARRFLRYAGINKKIDELEFFELNEHTQGVELNEYLKPCLEGKNVGLMSEAGVPCVADPGNVAVAKAHQLDIEVVPLIGPSSIILSLMGSGLNGQNFTFHGYLPVEPYDREKKLKAIEAYAVKTGQTQIFIETPYRNRRMVGSICKVCQPATRLCIAAGLTTEQQFLKTQSVSKWRKYFDDERNLMDKRPCIFLIGR
ncbi:MAG: SAM-dependent methyltransferase [Bacteroidales bacterium]|nr:SAM-dependent methyltransferase [Bacteroidales bacterium]